MFYSIVINSQRTVKLVMDKEINLLNFPDKDRAHECLRTVFEASFEGELDWHYQDTYLVFLYNYYTEFENDDFHLYNVLLKITELRTAIDCYWNDESTDER